MGICSKAVAALIILASVFNASGANASEVVAVTNPNAVNSYIVPKNLKWSKTALAAAGTAEKRVYEDLKAGIELLVSSGATRLVKVKSKWQTEEFSDWKLYVPDLLSYDLKGYDGNTLVMTYADAHAGPELATRLIYLKQSRCSLTTFKSMTFKDWSSKYCPIFIGSKEDYLRASIRVFMSMGEGYSWDAWYAKTVVTDCLKNKYVFTIKNGVFSCPKGFHYPEMGTIPLVKTGAHVGYRVVIDVNTKTAKFTYLEPLWQNWADHARDQGSAVIGF
jgi:hypothetical protein